MLANWQKFNQGSALHISGVFLSIRPFDHAQGKLSAQDDNLRITRLIIGGHKSR